MRLATAVREGFVSAQNLTEEWTYASDRLPPRSRILYFYAVSGLAAAEATRILVTWPAQPVVCVWRRVRK